MNQPIVCAANPLVDSYTEFSVVRFLGLRLKEIDDSLRGIYRHVPSGTIYEYRGVSWQNSWGLDDPGKYIFINLRNTSTHPNVVLEINGPNSISVDLKTFRESGSFVKI